MSLLFSELSEITAQQPTNENATKPEGKISNDDV